MRKSIIIFSTIVLLSCNDNKMGYVDYADLMDRYEAKKILEANFQKKAESFSKKRDSISQSLQIEFQAFQQRAPKLTESIAQQEYNGLQSRGQMIGQQLQMEEQTIQQEGQIAMDSLLKFVRSKVVSYGKEYGYSYILAGGEGGTVLYGQAGDNITDNVVDYLNSIKE